jgi:hypothetical protein
MSTTAVSRFRRLAATITVLTIGTTFAGPIAVSAADRPEQLEELLVDLWQDVLETPTAQNPFGTGSDVCWEIGADDETVSPFGPSGADACTVGVGTPIFVVASSLECSTVEGNGDTPKELADCARSLKRDVKRLEVRVDGDSVPLRQVQTDDFEFTLPADNLFGAPAGTTGTSVAFGWVALVPPLDVGTHTVTIRIITADRVETTITTTIVVE